jgi:hypothetical protein
MSASYYVSPYNIIMQNEGPYPVPYKRDFYTGHGTFMIKFAFPSTLNPFSPIYGQTDTAGNPA